MFLPLHLLWVLMIPVPGVLPEPVLKQTPTSEPVSAGQTAILRCRLQDGKVESYHVYWYRQRPGETPEWVMKHETDDDIFRASALTDRFQSSRDTSDNSFILTIDSLEPRDSAVYYCSVWESNVGYLNGPGTILSVKSSESRKPSVLLLPPSPDETRSGSATLSCLVSGFKPGFASLRWSVDGVETESGVTTGIASLEADQTYKLSSYLRVPAAAWNEGSNFSCIVNHSSLSSPLRESISSTSCAQ